MYYIIYISFYPKDVTFLKTHWCGRAGGSAEIILKLRASRPAAPYIVIMNGGRDVYVSDWEVFGHVQVLAQLWKTSLDYPLGRSR